MCARVCGVQNLDGRRFRSWNRFHDPWPRSTTRTSKMRGIVGVELTCGGVVRGLHTRISPMSSSYVGGALERELRDIRQRLLFMMDLAEGMLWSAVLALVTRDTELARSVAENGLELGRGQRELDTMCLDALTRHDRTTGELRLA